MKPGITYLILGTMAMALLIVTLLQIINMTAYLYQSFCDSIIFIDVINLESPEGTWMGV
jgi:hypothetical protein